MASMASSLALWTLTNEMWTPHGSASGLAAAIVAHMKTILITGCSSGYGLETARYFHAQGWNVIATMRTPREDVLPRSERVRVLALDVTKSESIAAALDASGPIDVLVNNAGIGVGRRFRSHADGDDARGVRDEHLRCDGDDAGGVAAVSCAQVGSGGERDLERDAGADAAGGRLHGEQDGHRRIHRVARARARAFQHPREVGRARLRPDDALHQQRRDHAWKG